jgi:hypothetical protein
LTEATRENETVGAGFCLTFLSHWRGCGSAACGTYARLKGLKLCKQQFLVFVDLKRVILGWISISLFPFYALRIN